MTKITFYPLGNADCCLLHLSNQLMFVFDYPMYAIRFLAIVPFIRQEFLVLFSIC
jgi:hypothetical protein